VQALISSAPPSIECHTGGLSAFQGAMVGSVPSGRKKAGTNRKAGKNSRVPAGRFI
jgi:hypothetical protein